MAENPMRRVRPGEDLMIEDFRIDVLNQPMGILADKTIEAEFVVKHGGFLVLNQ
jgi:hypothetical protein